jgi:hypothetical protein
MVANLLLDEGIFDDLYYTLLVDTTPSVYPTIKVSITNIFYVRTCDPILFSSKPIFLIIG